MQFKDCIFFIVSLKNLLESTLDKFEGENDELEDIILLLERIIRKSGIHLSLIYYIISIVITLTIRAVKQTLSSIKEIIIMRIKNTLERLETSVTGDKKYKPILKLIQQGAYFDEISEEMQELYCEYNFLFEADYQLSKICPEYFGDFNPHQKLMYKPKPPTPEEDEENYKQIQKELIKYEQEYNNNGY